MESPPERKLAGPAPGDRVREVRLDTLRLRYTVAGAGPPLLLIHGLGASGRWWRQSVPALSSHFSVYLVDLVGFGANRGQRFVLASAAHILARWMAAVGIARASVVGHSMGGYVAAELAATAPDRVDRLVLVDAAGLPIPGTFLHHVRDLVRSLRGIPRDLVRLAIADYLRAGVLTMIGAGTAVVRGDLSGRLGEIRCPTLIVWGERDPLIPLSSGRRLAELIPGSRLHVLPGVGHAPMWERPEEFDRLVLDFLLPATVSADTDLSRRGGPPPSEGQAPPAHDRIAVTGGT